MHADERRCEDLKPISEAIIGAAYEVGNVLGGGFLEKVYENALVFELQERGLKALQQAPLRVPYKGQTVGEYFADIIVEDRVVVEIKCVEAFSSAHVAQCLNYLKATGLNLALLLNFQTSKVQVKRIALGG